MVATIDSSTTNVSQVIRGVHMWVKGWRVETDGSAMALLVSGYGFHLRKC